MSPVKSKKTKKKVIVKNKVSKTKEKVKKVEPQEEETDLKEESDSFPVKGKKDAIIAIDEHVEVEVPEEKTDDEVLVKPEDIEDLLADELSLDDEELNPFGDKWEE